MITPRSHTPLLQTWLLFGMLFAGLPLADSEEPQTLYKIHGTARTCSMISELDSALSVNFQAFFAGWTPADYADALNWARACAAWGWHVLGHPRIELLQSQRDRALGTARADLGTRAVSGSARADLGTTAVSGTARSVATTAAFGAAKAEGAASATPPVSVAALAAAPPPAFPAAGGAPAVDKRDTTPLNEEFFQKHFHEESLWVARRAKLDIGDERPRSSWTDGGTPAQLRNRLTADRIVLYCEKKTDPDEVTQHPLLWDLRHCETEEAAAYDRMVAQNEFPNAGRDIFLQCADANSYVDVEHCMTMALQSRGH